MEEVRRHVLHNPRLRLPCTALVAAAASPLSASCIVIEAKRALVVPCLVELWRSDVQQPFEAREVRGHAAWGKCGRSVRPQCDRPSRACEVPHQRLDFFDFPGRCRPASSPIATQILVPNEDEPLLLLGLGCEQPADDLQARCFCP